MKTYTKTLYGVPAAKAIRCQTEKAAKAWVEQMHPGCVWTYQPGEAGPYYMYGLDGMIQPLYTLGPGAKRLAGSRDGNVVGRVVSLRVYPKDPATGRPKTTYKVHQPRGWLAVVAVTPENAHNLDALAAKARRRRQGCRTRPANSPSGCTPSGTRTSPT